ncbi:helicase ARIP4-like protein [Anopheles sinensis]|uniref:Helicase ARIP4-like protein n=1 Tax=Anopheles sinensis TaxID=74873 RepID=A0A084VX45_ANOSI|nr:helicase ARIP4-like protein [Anopheles sinensis]
MTLSASVVIRKYKRNRRRSVAERRSVQFSVAAAERSDTEKPSCARQCLGAARSYGAGTAAAAACEALRTEPMSRWDCNGRREAPPGQRPPQHPGQNNGVGGAPPLPFESGKDGSAERSQVQLRLPKAQNVTRTPGYTHVGSVGMTTDTRLPVRYPPAIAPYTPYHQQQQPAAPAANGINGVQRPAALYPAYGWTSQSRAIPPNRGATGCTQPNKFTDSIYPQRPLPPSGDSSCATFGKYNTPRNGLRIARTLASSSMGKFPTTRFSCQCWA